MSKIFTLCSAAVVLVATGAFAQMPKDSLPAKNSNPCPCLEQGMGFPSDAKCFPAAYNAPAGIAVKCGWDFNVFGSFIYWHVSEEALDYAFIEPVAAGVTAGTRGLVAYPDFEYKRGFQAGFGFNTNYDDWVGWVEYTWLHQSTSTSLTAPPTVGGATGTFGGIGSSTPSWFPIAFSNTYTVASSKWKMHLDMLDAMFSRPYYQGTQLTVSPYAGLRALWIRQRMTVSMSQATGVNIPIYSTTMSNSWAIGPAVGTMGHWLLGCGFRFEGEATGSLLYTQYTTIANHITFASTSGAVSSITDYNTLRAMAQLGVGLGWGSYLYRQAFYLDFSARYDFNYLWNQNVMRLFISQLLGRGDDCGDLALHGLTVAARFDF